MREMIRRKIIGIIKALGLLPEPVSIRAEDDDREYLNSIPKLAPPGLSPGLFSYCRKRKSRTQKPGDIDGVAAADCRRRLLVHSALLALLIGGLLLALLPLLVRLVLPVILLVGLVLLPC